MAICKTCGKKYSRWTTPVSARGVCRECFESELENEREAEPQQDASSLRNLSGEKADESPKLHRVPLLNTGSVSKVTVIQSTGFPGLDNEAIFALHQWRWKPRRWKEIDIPVTFTFRRTGQAAELERYLESQRKKSFERYRREH